MRTNGSSRTKPPFLCDHLLLNMNISHIMVAHLLPKLRCYFAEFLNQGSLKRLGILSLPTCVGLRYDHLKISIEVFLGNMGSITYELNSRYHISVLISERICLLTKPTCLYLVIQHQDDLPFCVTPSLKRFFGGTGIFTCLPSPTPFGLGLGID